MIYSYRNTKTGASFQTTVKCSGKNWQLQADKPQPKVEPEQEVTEEAPKQAKKARK